MQTNALPAFDATANETGCCPRFRPEPWDNQELHFDNKPFVKASTISLFHLPLNMGGDFLTRVFEGPYSKAREWCAEMETCPRCAKHYGKNYVVGVAKVRS